MSDEVKARRIKGGRPRKHPCGTRRPVMAFRIRDDMHEKLIASASDQRSLSEEIERRLAASFDAEALETMLRRVIAEELDKRSFPAMAFDDALAVMSDAQH